MVNDPKRINERLRQPDTRQAALVELAEWVKDTCLMFGVSVSLAYKVASMFVGGIEAEVPLDDLVASTPVCPVCGGTLAHEPGCSENLKTNPRAASKED